ncbi:serine hydrolase domain-containing protein [Bacillus aquiflavi]|nr:serine hydrolase [Bacillus aquiflavi]
MKETLKKVCYEIDFSGVIFVKREADVIFQLTAGYSNRADKRANLINTKFGIASGCKLFTAIGICQLVEKGMLSFDTKLKDCLHISFPYFHEDITIHHLLTHTSGIPDYFDEAVMDDYADLWKERPTYHMNSLTDFLPMFQKNQMMYKPGEKFHYNNAGFIVLGLIIEQHTGLAFTDYIESNVFARCGMADSGYFSLDHLPSNTAYGYIDHKDGTWRTNFFSIPIKGGADGGAFITAQDMMKCWEGLLDYKLLSKKYTNILLTPHVTVKNEQHYGYGIWISKKNGDIFKYYVIGYDPGVSFHSSFYPGLGIKAVIPSNKSSGPYEIIKSIEDNLIINK